MNELRNRSIAVWAVRVAHAPASTMEVHFNYWRIAGDEEFVRKTKGVAKDFLEVGIMLEKPRDVERVCMYIPEAITPTELKDCGRYFKEAEIAQGIFNERLAASVSPAPGPRCVELKKDEQAFCRVHQFMLAEGRIDEAELEHVALAEGTLLTITRRAVQEACGSPDYLGRAYFRLRIYLAPGRGRGLIRQMPTPDRWLQSGFDEIEYIDFRLNEARTLPPKVESKMREDQAGVGVKIALVALLTAVPVLSELAASNAEFHKLRLLEHRLWNSYVPSGIPDGMMVYHWRRSSPPDIVDFSAFLKLQTRRSGRRTLWKYIVIGFGFGVLGNLVAAAVQAGAVATWESFHSSVPAQRVGGASGTATPSTPVRR